MKDSPNQNPALESYDQQFYANQVDGSALSARIIAPIVLELLPGTESIVDVGCGAGTWLSQFKHLGVGSVVGYDGGSPPGEYLMIEPEEFRQADFTQGFPDQQKVDLAMSVEVAEHLAPEHAAGFVHQLCILSDAVLFSAAIPGQGGTGHVNERWPGYWADLFAGEGFGFFDVIRPRIWHEARIEWWYRQNLFLAARHGNQELTLRLEELERKLKPALDTVHPDMYLKARNRVHAIEQACQGLGAPEQAIASLKAIKHDLDAIQNSLSWKLTNGPRNLAGLAGKLFKRN